MCCIIKHDCKEYYDVKTRIGRSLASYVKSNRKVGWIWAWIWEPYETSRLFKFKCVTGKHPLHVIKIQRVPLINHLWCSTPWQCAAMIYYEVFTILSLALQAHHDNIVPSDTHSMDIIYQVNCSVGFIWFAPTRNLTTASEPQFAHTLWKQSPLYIHTYVNHTCQRCAWQRD